MKKRRLVFTPSAENSQSVTESQSDITTTVPAQLKELQPFLQKSLNASYQVANANTKAMADVVLDDSTVLLSNVPATALLELEKRISDIHGILQAIPTLDPAKSFTADAQRGPGYYKAREVRKTRTKKTFVPLVLAAATKEHPAQVKEGYEDQPIGSIAEQEWSGLLTPSEKSAMLAKCEEVSRAVRAARSRANEQEVDKTLKIADKLLGHIFGK